MRENLKRKKTIWIAVCACCAAICVIVGAVRAAGVWQERQTEQETIRESGEEQAAQAAESQAVQGDAAEGSPASQEDDDQADAQADELAAQTGEARVPALDEEQKELLDRLSVQIEEQRYEEAARLMFERADDLAELYYEVMDQERFLYRDGRLSEAPDGDGLVLARSSLVFCGSFASGAPEGSCTALQAVELDYPRYDFASGQWKAGKMNGSGRIGYCCYEGAGEENRQMVREGEFLENRMNGQVRLSTVNAQGEESVWEMTADDGALVLDDLWLYDAADDSYRLPAEQDPSHAYLVTGKEAPGFRFENMILWE